MTAIGNDLGASGRERLCLALDLADRGEILALVDELKDLIGYFKLNSAFTLHGPDLVRELLARDVKVFMDLKLHDIPNTLAGYGHAVTGLGAHLVTLHTGGGLEMMRAAVTAADRTAAELGVERPKLVGVTLLTSVDRETLNGDLNVSGTIEDEVRRRALLAAEAGLDGIVCAPSEIDLVRPGLPDDFFYVTPGTRSPGESGNDHKRIGTHAEALAGGSSLLVLGRRIHHAADRRKAALEVLHEIEGIA
ncbi:orotidine-5'-phosphate decarboxylase [Streptomyces sp. PKU-EA00015]|uniref:orotidine-5'-phosphate decarboxylase n=1 Tax=Streptomyces sp. PKU-EA00015 TaxID=2748326 RepID=UPI0015A02113|nr:orotidine-5'-phosphate decarboxylase [Streptomyces sp. PKU-EA00015]NWF29765.1 orotidine-5'-phosphate decarboxylase [Streptomyces sp. PKU-EA00015]